MHADPAPAAPADRISADRISGDHISGDRISGDRISTAPIGASLVTLPQQIVLHAGMRLVVVDCWRLPTADLLRDGAVQRVGQARTAGDGRHTVRFDRIAQDLSDLSDRRTSDAPPPRATRCDLPTSIAPGPTVLWRPALASHPHAALTAAVLRQMQRAPGAPHRLVAIGAELGVSPYHVAHVFREQTGLSVHRYLLRLRLAIALDLLAGGAMNLSALALDLGFSSHSHFSSVFRRNTGLSPTGVRAAFLARPGARLASRTALRPALRATLAS